MSTHIHSDSTFKVISFRVARGRLDGNFSQVPGTYVSKIRGGKPQ